jgi:F420-dependent methylenetetrahydromethanopterin dehydrogenase
MARDADEINMAFNPCENLVSISEDVNVCTFKSSFVEQGYHKSLLNIVATQSTVLAFALELVLQSQGVELSQDQDKRAPKLR